MTVTYLAGLLWLVAAAAAATGIGYLVWRIRPGRAARPTKQDDTATSAVFTMVSGLHAVVMVFVLIDLFDAAVTAEDDSYREANSLVAVSWASDALPEPARSQIHTLSRAYANTVIEQEWPRMRNAEQVEATGWAQLDDVRQAIQQANTTDQWQQDQRTEAATRLWEVYQARQDRLNAANNGISAVLWFVLIIGSLMAMAVPWLFRGTNLLTHLLVVSTLAATIVLVLFAIYQMQNPFSGGAEIDPEAFQAVLDRLS